MFKSKYEAINTILTEATSKYLGNGYKVCSQSMRGSQGEIAKVDFLDEAGMRVVRVFARDRYSTCSYHSFEHEVEVVEEEFFLKSLDYIDTLWNDEGRTIEVKHIMVKDDGSSIVMGHMEYMEMLSKKKERREARSSRFTKEDITDEALVTTLVGLVRAQKEPGFKRFKLGDVARAEKWVRGAKCSYFLKFTNGKSVNMKHNPDGGMVYSFGA